jgi:hypothetical protein
LGCGGREVASIASKSPDICSAKRPWKNVYTGKDGRLKISVRNSFNFDMQIAENYLFVIPRLNVCTVCYCSRQGNIWSKTVAPASKNKIIFRRIRLLVSLILINNNNDGVQLLLYEFVRNIKTQGQRNTVYFICFTAYTEKQWHRSSSNKRWS